MTKTKRNTTCVYDDMFSPIRLYKHFSFGIKRQEAE